ncbi:hypothetical protein ACOSQ3_002543 [Xanthoceras sorbifolium]
MAPYRYKEALNIGFQLSITVGILIHSLCHCTSLRWLHTDTEELSTLAFNCQSQLTVVSACIVAKFGVDGNPGELPEWYAIVVVLFICIYVIGFSWSWGPLGWLVPSEIFPLEIRLAGQSINISVNMFFTFAMLKSCYQCSAI